MLAKIWKKVGLIVLIIACLWNIVYKLVNKISFDVAIDDAKTNIEQQQEENKTEEIKKEDNKKVENKKSENKIEETKKEENKENKIAN